MSVSQDLTLTPLLALDRPVRNESDVSVDKNTEFISFLELVQKNPRVYRFLVLMGMVIVDDKFEYCGISKWCVMFWNYFLVSTLFVYLLPQIAVAVLDSLSFFEHFHGPINVSLVVFFAIQVFVIWYGVFYLRRAIREKQWLNREWYLSTFEYSLRTCKYVLLVVCFFSVFTLVCYIKFRSIHCRSDHKSMCQILNVITDIQFGVVLGGSCFLVGSLFVLVVEQRISLLTMKALVDMTREKTATHAIYFSTRNSIKAREERLPVNVVVFAALLNSVLGIIMLLIYISVTSYNSADYWLFTVGYEISAYGREFIILLVLLYEIVQVNDQAQVMIQTLAESEWGDRDAELVRQSVFMACIGKPIGATIFYKKPTRNQILLQLASSTIVTIIAILKAYFVAK